MVFVPQLQKRDMHLLTTYALSDTEEMCEAIVCAFQSADINVFEKPTELADWIDADAFDALQWSSKRPHLLSTRIWDHHVVLTGEAVCIYKT